MTDFGIKEALDILGVKDVNDGTSTGQHNFSNGEVIESYSPVDGKLIGKVKTTTKEDYDKVMKTASAAFVSWRSKPAPLRGEIVRQFGEKLREKKESREAFIDELMMPVGRQLAEQNLSFEIKGRPKHIYSIYRKMQRQQKPFEEIYDLFAIRIILEEPHTKEDCWRVYSIITDWYTPIPERFRDFIPRLSVFFYFIQK